MQISYNDGMLGPYEQGTALSLPMVSDYLQSKFDDNERRGKNRDKAETRRLMLRVREHITTLVDDCAPPAELTRLQKAKLRLHECEESANSRLAALPADGTNVFLDATEGATALPALRVTMHPFEVVQLGTLMPKTAAEAVALIPSLRRFESEDLFHAIASLHGSVHLGAKA